jgi:antitoxin VapB
MGRGPLFLSNTTRALRLPGAVRFADGVRSAGIVRRGRSLLITPRGQGRADWFEGAGVSADYMAARDRPEPQARLM